MTFTTCPTCYLFYAEEQSILNMERWLKITVYPAYVLTRGSQRDVVYLGLPIAQSYISPNAGDGGGVSADEYSCAHGAQINFGDLTPYLTYGFDLLLVFTHAKNMAI
jgi:hypothetical protein